MVTVPATCKEPASVLADSNDAPLPCLLLSGSKGSKQSPKTISRSDSRCSTADSSSLASEFDRRPRVSCVRNSAFQRLELDVPPSPTFETPQIRAPGSCRASFCVQHGSRKNSLETDEVTDEACVPELWTLPSDLERYRTDDIFEKPMQLPSLDELWEIFDDGRGNTDVPAMSTLPSELDRYRTDDAFDNPMPLPLFAATVMTAQPEFATVVQLAQPRCKNRHISPGPCCFEPAPNGMPRDPKEMKPCLDMLRYGKCHRMRKNKECNFCHKHPRDSGRYRPPQCQRRAAGGA